MAGGLACAVRVRAVLPCCRVWCVRAGCACVQCGCLVCVGGACSLKAREQGEMGGPALSMRGMARSRETLPREMILD